MKSRALIIAILGLVFLVVIFLLGGYVKKPVKKELESGVIISDNKTKFLVFTSGREYITSFTLTDIRSIEYIEVTVNVKTTPSGYNELADGNTILLVMINDKLPYEGDFGLTPTLQKWIETELEKKSLEEREQWKRIFAMLSRGIILIKEPFGIGNEGTRRVRFNQTALLEGKNILRLLNVEEGKKANEGDGIWIYNLKVSVKRSEKVEEKKKLEVIKRPEDFHKASNESLELNVTEISLNQPVQVGEYLVRIINVERVDEYIYEGLWRGRYGEKKLMVAHEGHEFLIFEVEYEKLSKEEAEKNIKKGFVSPLIVAGIPIGWGDFKGVTFELAYAEGYDGPVVIDGICKIDPNVNHTVGWKGKGKCEFYYRKEWKPQYLVLSSYSKGILLIFPIGKSIPVAKLKV